MRLRKFACGVIVIAFTYASAGSAPDRLVSDAATRSLELPRAWDLKEIEAVAAPYGVGGKVYVLAWLVREDERPLRLEECLVLKDIGDGKDDEIGRWGLAHLYRHPLGTDNRWRLPRPQISPPPPLGPEKAVGILHVARFKRKPTNQDIYGSFDDVPWRFTPEKGWKLVSCAVCERNWETAIGEKPTRFFGDQ